MESTHTRSKTVALNSYKPDDYETPYTTNQNRNTRLLQALKNRSVSNCMLNTCYFSNNLRVEGHARVKSDQHEKLTFDKSKDDGLNVKRFPISGYSRFLASLRTKGSRYNPHKAVYKPGLETSFSNKKILTKETFSPTKYDISNPFGLKARREICQSAPSVKRQIKVRHNSEVYISGQKNTYEGYPLICSVSPTMLEYKIYKIR
jgi:hypothetical protein